MSDELRPGEIIVAYAGGLCYVCKQRIAAGPAVQLSSRSNQIRHVGCMPKTNSRSSTYRRFRPIGYVSG